jgi:hypothetical protein
MHFAERRTSRPLSGHRMFPRSKTRSSWCESSTNRCGLGRCMSRRLTSPFPQRALQAGGFRTGGQANPAVDRLIQQRGRWCVPPSGSVHQAAAASGARREETPLPALAGARTRTLHSDCCGSMERGKWWVSEHSRSCSSADGSTCAWLTSTTSRRPSLRWLARFITTYRAWMLRAVTFPWAAP